MGRRAISGDSRRTSVCRPGPRPGVLQQGARCVGARGLQEWIGLIPFIVAIRVGMRLIMPNRMAKLLTFLFLTALIDASAQHKLPAFKAPAIAEASDQAELAIKSFTVRPGFQVELFAAEPLLAHPVAFAIDEQNRIFVSESFRVGDQVTDIRQHMTWLDEELASTNTAQLRQLINKYLDVKKRVHDSRNRTHSAVGGYRWRWQSR